MLISAPKLFTSHFDLAYSAAVFQTLLLRRLGVPLALTDRHCLCRLLDPLARHVPGLAFSVAAG